MLRENGGFALIDVGALGGIGSETRTTTVLRYDVLERAVEHAR